MCNSGQFVWKKIGDNHVPTIMRNDNEYYVASRMVQNIIHVFLKLFHQDVYNMCLNIDSYHISRSEAKLLTFINETYIKKTSGLKVYQSGEDYIIRLGDVQELYTFFDKFYKKFIFKDLSCVVNCGFFILKKDGLGMAIPFCEQDGENYVPISFIDMQLGYNEQIPRVRLNNWSITYLKMCYLTMRIDNVSMYEDDKFEAVNINDLVHYFGIQYHFSLWMNSDHLIRDLRCSVYHDTLTDVWFNKPGIRTRTQPNGATWKVANMDPPPGVEGPIVAEYSLGYTGGFNAVVDNVYLPPE